MRHSRMLATCSALALSVGLGIPAAASAARKDVSLGPPPAASKALQKTGSDVNDFFPHRVTIHVGDKVRFVPNGFHTVDLPGTRRRKLPLVSPTGQPVAGAVDAAGAPFWFNGQQNFGFSPRLLQPGFGKARRYTGAKAVLSGLPLARKPKPMTVTFTKAGTVRYFCDIHPGMTGIVRVVAASRPVPSAAADRRTLRRQEAATLKTAKALPRAAAPPANTVDVGLGGKGNVSLFAFVPSTMTVPHGTTVTFRIAARTELHTATIGPGNPGDPKQANTYLGQVEAGFNQNPLDPRAVFPSDPPGTIGALTPTFHGNGFWNSGVLDQDPATPASFLPSSRQVTFAGPGTYQVFCLIHPFMHGTITVT
jgi:plastocyanin